MSFKKICAVATVCIITIEAIVMLIKRYYKKDNIHIENRKMSNADFGMRYIENPFESLVEKEDNSQQPIFVNNPEFKKWKVYKNDILSIIGILVVIIIVIGISIVSFNSRQQQEDALKTEVQRYENSVLQALDNIENNSTVLSERTDSMCFQIKEGIDSLKEIFTKFQKTQNKKK